MIPRGTAHHNSIMEEDDVRNARIIYDEGLVLRAKLEEMSVRGLARTYGVSKQTMFEIVSRRSWKHVI